MDGEEQTLTRDALMSYVQGPNPNLRAAAYQELYSYLRPKRRCWHRSIQIASAIGIASR